MKKVVNHPYQKFQRALIKSEAKEERWQGLTFSKVEPSLSLWDSMSSRSKGRVVSDSRWNHYPMASYSKHSKKRFGYIVALIVKRALKVDDRETLRVLSNKSEGVFAIHTLDHTTSSMRIKMAKRLMNSPDARIRTRCARILPVKYMFQMLEDKHYSVRNIAITRVGIDNCYKDFIPSTILPRAKEGPYGAYWYLNWLSRQAMGLCEKEDLLSLIEEAKKLDIKEVDFRGIETIISALINRLTPEEALYFMGFGEQSTYIKRALQEKMDFR